MTLAARLSWVRAVALLEARRQLGSWVTLILVAFLVLQAAFYALNAETMAQIGAADVPRNSAYVIYHFTSDNGFWLIFFLAHIMSSPVVSDLTHHQAEVAYALPGGLRTYLLGKYLGALATGLVVAAGTSFAWVVVPLALRHLGGQADLFMPTPWLQVFHAYALFLLPSVFGFGTLYFAATARTGRAAPAFGASFVLTVVWMFAIIVLRKNEVHRVASEWLDPIGYNSVQEQLGYWPAEERIDGVMRLTAPFLANRLGLLALGALSLLGAFVRVSPERLLVNRERARRPDPRADARATSLLLPVAPRLRFDLTGWLTLTLRTAARLLGENLRSGMAILVLGGGGLLMVATGFFRVQDSVDGPQRPWTALVMPPLTEFFYFPTALFLCFAAGRWVTQERDHGLGQILDALPVPTWVQATSRVLALVGLSLALALVPALSLWAVQALLDPSTFRPAEAIFTSVAVLWPSNIQVALLSLFFYVALSNRWLAHFFAFTTVFLCVMNHALDVVSHSAFQFAIPIHVYHSPLTGFTPWLEPAFWLNGWLLSLTGLLTWVTFQLWPRGTELDASTRLRTAWSERSWPRLGTLLTLIALAVLSGRRVFHAIDVDHRYRSHDQERAEAARYELTYGSHRHDPAPRIVDGSLEVDLRLAEREVRHVYALTLTNTSTEALTGFSFDLPERVQVQSLVVDGAPPASHQHDDALRHDTVTLARPLPPGDRVRVVWKLAIGWPSFANEGKPHLVTPTGAWLRGEDLLPRLGYDRRRELRPAAHRREHGLPEQRPTPDRADAQAYGLDDHGFPLSVRVRAPASLALIVTGAPDGQGEVVGRVEGSERLAIATGTFARLESAPSPPSQAPVSVFYEPQRADVARASLDAAFGTLGRLGERFGPYRHERLRVVEVPSEIKHTGLYGDVLLLGESDGWNIRADNPALLVRVAQQLGRHWWVEQFRPAQLPGYSALGEGLPLASALLVADDILGHEARARITDRLGDRSLRAIAEGRDPIVPMADADDGAYLPLYAGLTWQRLRHDLGQAPVDAVLRAQLASCPGPSGCLASLDALTRALAPLDPAGEVPRALTSLRAWSIRAKSARVTSADSSGTHLSLDLDVTTYRFDGRGWRITPEAPDRIPVALLDEHDRELGRTTADLSSGATHAAVVWPQRPAAIVLDPDRILFDRNLEQDRQAVRRASIRP